MNEIIEAKRSYNKKIDKTASDIAKDYLKNKKVTLEVLKAINSFYSSAKLDVFDDKQFDSAYHNPITSDVEFLIARILFYIIKEKGLSWKVNLRKQKNKCAPDIRIDVDKETSFIIEIKVKVGWIQQIFSDRRFDYDQTRYDKGIIQIAPSKRVQEVKE